MFVVRCYISLSWDMTLSVYECILVVKGLPILHMSTLVFTDNQVNTCVIKYPYSYIYFSILLAYHRPD
jgi:hypothetical protein